MAKANLTQNDWTNFIKSKLPALIEKDLVNFLLFREADLQSCCYLHLRRFAEKNEGKKQQRWKILNQPWLRGLSSKPDLVICKGDKPVLIIELKFRRQSSGLKGKDAQVLKDAVENREWAKKVFFIEVVLEPGHQKGDKGAIPKYRGKVISIGFPNDEKPDGFEIRYKSLRKPPPRGAKKS